MPEILLTWSAAAIADSPRSSCVRIETASRSRSCCHAGMAGPLIVPPVLREPLASRILVVDDEPLIRWALCSALEAAGFDAVCAASSADARRAASDWPPPRVALVDLLSEQDARDLLADIRRIYPACRFVLMTTADREWPGMSDDDVEFLEKPFDLSRVVSLVSRMGAASPLPAGGA